MKIKLSEYETIVREDEDSYYIWNSKRQSLGIRPKDSANWKYARKVVDHFKFDKEELNKLLEQYK